MIQKFTLLLLSLSLVLIFSCSNQDNQPVSPPEKNNLPKKVDLIEVTPPSALIESDAAEAKQVLEYFRMLNGIKDLQKIVNPPEQVAVDALEDYWSGSWGYEDVILYWEAWYEGEIYKVEITADGSFYGFNFNNVKFLELESSSDGRIGMLNLYGPNGFKLSSWDWTLDDDEVYSINYLTPLGGLIEAEVNPDLSGWMEYYEGDTFVFGIIWNSDGSWIWLNEKV